MSSSYFGTIPAIFQLFFRTLILLPRIKSWRKEEILAAVTENGIESLPIILMSTAFAGIVVTHQIAWHMKISLHDVSMIPGFSAQFIIRELGIAIPALLLVAKSGAATTAELGTMKITEQVDALKLLGINPVSYLVFPRFIAGLISGGCLTVISVFVTLLCAVSVAVFGYSFSFLEFINSLRHFVGIQDLLCAVTKGVVFGGMIPIVACTYGFRCQGGAEGVGTATTNSVVTATIAVIVLDFLMTYLFTWIL